VIVPAEGRQAAESSGRPKDLSIVGARNQASEPPFDSPNLKPVARFGGPAPRVDYRSFPGRAWVERRRSHARPQRCPRRPRRRLRPREPAVGSAHPARDGWFHAGVESHSDLPCV